MQTFFPSTWTIAFFCSANLVYDENNYVFVSYFTYGLMYFLQISAHSKLDTDEVAVRLSLSVSCASPPLVPIFGCSCPRFLFIS